jgi:WD40 repeat protein
VTRGRGLDWTIAQVRERLDESGLTDPAGEVLLASPGGTAERLLVVVDQLEELLTQTAPAERARFAELIRGALSGPVLVVATLRSEFLDRFLTLPELADLRPRLHPVQPLGRQSLGAVVKGPARIAGIRVDDELVDRLVADTDNGAALPLLAFALAELARGVGRGDELSAGRYDQLGGVQGALTRQADAALADAMQAEGRSRDDVLAGLLRLVTVDEQGNPTSWRVDRSELPGTVDAELDAFVARRLLVTDTTDDGSAVIGVAHEAFLTAWPPLRAAIDAEASALRARRAVEHGAAEWDRSGRPDERLWERGQLAAAVAETGARVEARPSDSAPSERAHPALRLPRPRTVVTDRVPVSATAREFLLASIRRDRLRRGRATAVLSVLCVLALVAAGIAFVQRQTAQEQQRVATARQLVAQADLVRGTEPQTALMLNIAAERIHSDAHTSAALVEGLTSSQYAGTLPAHTASRGSPVLSSDGRLMATVGGGGTVILWDVAGERPRQLATLVPSDFAILSVEGFSPDAGILATTSGDGRIELWDVTAPSAPHPVGKPIPVPGTTYLQLRFSPDGRTLAVAKSDRRAPATVELWDISDPAQARRLGELVDLGPELQLLEFHQNGTALITATSENDGRPGESRGVVVWDIADPANPRPVGSPIDYGGKAAFHPGTGLLATNTDAYGNSVIMWDLTDPGAPRQLPGDDLETQQLAGLFAPNGSVIDLDASIQVLEFAPDGATLAAASWLGPGRSALMIWDATTRWLQPMYGYRILADSEIVDVAFTPDRRFVVTVTGRDRNVTMWDLTDRTTALQIGPTIARTDGAWEAVLPNGRSLLTSRSDGTVTMWDFVDSARPRRLGPPIAGGRWVTSLEYVRGPDALVIGRDDGSVEQRAFDGSVPSGPARLLRPGAADHKLAETVIAPQTALVATSESDGSIVVTDVRGSRYGRISQPLPGASHAGRAWPLGFSPDGRLMTTGLEILGERPSMLLWDVSDPTRPRSVSGPITLGRSPAAFSPTRPLLATQVITGERPGVQLINISDPARPEPIGDPLTGYADPVRTLSFSPDGRMLASATHDRSIILWDVTDPAHPRRRGLPLTGHTFYANSLAISPDGRTLASGSSSAEVLLWDLTDPAQPRRLGRPLAGGKAGASALLFAPDGNTLVTAEYDEVITWDLTELNAVRDNARKIACERTGRGLDPVEWARYIAAPGYEDTCSN